MRRWWMALLAAVAFAAAAPAANAQAQSPAPAPAEPSQNIPEQKLDAAAAALDRIVGVKDNYQQQIDSAADPAEKQRLVEEANGAILKAVTDQGLSVEEYTAILVVARNDPVVRQKIIQRMRPADR
jgi:Domain of unknown function (DUF4168)